MIALAWIALVLGVIDVARSRGQSLAGWGVIAIALYVVLPVILEALGL